MKRNRCAQWCIPIVLPINSSNDWVSAQYPKNRIDVFEEKVETKRKLKTFKLWDQYA